METGALGKVYSDGEIIIRQGEKGDSMYFIQDGYVEVVKDFAGLNSQVAILGKGDFFGEMEILEHEPRLATVRALGTARVLTIDKEKFLRRIHEDPSSAYRMLQIMSKRVRKSDEEFVRFKISLPDHGMPPEPEKEEHFVTRIRRLISSVTRHAALLSKSTNDHASISVVK